MQRRLLILSSIITIGFALAIIIIVFTSSNVVGFYHNMPMTMRMSSINNGQQIWPVGSMVRENDSINMLSNMMNQEPKDVIIEMNSSQIVPVGKESEIALLVSDKETQKPLTGAQVLVGIERGASMTTMEMIGGSMFEAKEQEDKDKISGIYKVRFTPDSEGYYTIHIHVIPFGNSMHSMMDNHLDIGIIVE
jgi:hypothetical protein